jgi:hypothetical protein
VVNMSFFSMVVSLEIRMEHRNPPAHGTTRRPVDMFRLCRNIGDNVGRVFLFVGGGSVGAVVPSSLGVTEIGRIANDSLILNRVN